MKSIEKMINEIDIESLEKTINMLSGLKTFKKYNCETCRHEISSICLDCNIKNKSKGWEPKEEKIDCQTCRFNIHECGICHYEKEPKKSIEEQVFELIKDSFIFCNIDKHIDAFKELINKIYFLKEDYQLAVFMVIMKGVHQLIEGDNFVKSEDLKPGMINIHNEYQKYFFIQCKKVKNEIFEYIIVQKNPYVKIGTYFFEFSSEKNAEKAKNILSNFFGINILDWWYK